MFYSGRDIYTGVGTEGQKNMSILTKATSQVTPQYNHLRTTSQLPRGHERGTAAHPHTQDYNKSTAWHTVYAQ